MLIQSEVSSSVHLTILLLTCETYGREQSLKDHRLTAGHPRKGIGSVEVTPK